MNRMEKYCAYQERSHFETSRKLSELGCYGDEAGMIMMELVRNGFLDEERFAKSFCRGRFRIKKWGRNKIINELRAHHVSDYCIREGMKEIDGSEYLRTLKELAEKKLQLLRGEKNKAIRYKKTGSYLFQKGYEPDLIREILSELTQV